MQGSGPHSHTSSDQDNPATTLIPFGRCGSCHELLRGGERDTLQQTDTSAPFS
jgi:hypothetical protein